MTRVPALTSRVGAFQFRRQVIWRYKPDITSSWINATSNPTYGFSNRAPVEKTGAHKKATNYHRKLAVLTSLNDTNVKTSSHALKGEGSLHAAFGITLQSTVHGSAYLNTGTSVPSWMSDKAVQDCVNDLNGQAANLMEDLAQALSTARMFVEIFLSIVDAYEALVKGNRAGMKRALARGKKLANNYLKAGKGQRSAKPLRPNFPRLSAGGRKAIKQASSQWLVFYYGVKPLIGTLDALAGFPPGRNKAIKASRKISRSVDPAAFVNQDNGMQVTGQAYQRVLVGMSVHVEQTNTYAYWNSLGFSGNTFTDAAVLAWAIIPYSFVLDWILPV